MIDGQNNHRWQTMTPVMKVQMEKSGLFKVDVTTTPPRKPRRRKGQPAPEDASKQAEALKEIWLESMATGHSTAPLTRPWNFKVFLMPYP